MAKVFSDRATRDIMDVVRRYRNRRPNPDTSAIERLGKPLQCYIAKTGASGIAARSGTTPGSASVTLYYINASGALATWNDANGDPITDTCYNMSTTAVGNSVYIIAQQELLSGKLLAVWEDC